MYICNNCGNEFDSPAVIEEKHALETPPYEKIYVCPRCKTTDYENAEYRYCRCCGARLSQKDELYCSSRCESNGKKLYQKELAQKRQLADSPLYKLVREIESYNLKSQKRLSYGQYVSLFKRKGGKKK